MIPQSSALKIRIDFPSVVDPAQLRFENQKPSKSKKQAL